MPSLPQKESESISSMSMSTLYDRLLALPHPPQGVAAAVPPEIIAFNVAVSRKLRAWKQSTLADLAGVSLTTVERVERGEKVLAEALERIGAALGFPPGYYTADRVPLTPAELTASGATPYPHLAFVKVAPLKTQAQFRALATCDALVHAPLGEQSDNAGLADGVFKLIELLALRLAAPSLFDKAKTGGLRDLYRMLNAQIDELGRNGFGVISGIDEEMHSGTPRRIAVAGIARRANDPGVLRRKVLVLDRRDFAPVSVTPSEKHR